MAFWGGGGGLGCHKFKSLGKLSNGWTDWPQILHTSADPSGNGHTPNKLPLETQGHLGGLGVLKSLGKLSNGWTDWFTSADSSGNGHRLNTIRPTIPQRHLGGCRGSQMFGKAAKRLDRLAPNLVQTCGLVWESTEGKYNSPLNIPWGHFGGFRRSQIQKYVEAVKRLDRLAPNLAHMCRSIWEWIYAKQIALQDTREALGGSRGSIIQKSREAVKRFDRLTPTLVHVCGFIWEWT